MKINFTYNDKSYQLVDQANVVSVGDETLWIKTIDDWEFSIAFDTDHVIGLEKAKRFFSIVDGKLEIKLVNWHSNLGHYFPDIVDINNGFSIHISSRYSEKNIRNTKIFIYKQKQQ